MPPANVQVVNLHAKAGTGKENQKLRRTLLERLVEQTKQQASRCIVVGDFNCTMAA